MADKKYSLKERYNYHKQLANSQKDKDGKKLNMSDRIRHGIQAEKCRQKLNRFMKAAEFGKNNFK